MSEGLAASAQEQFAAAFGHAPQGVVFVPGRVNLIGEHVDYNDGLVLPMPVREGTAIAWRSAPGGEIHVKAADFGSEDRFDLSLPEKPEATDWRAYVRGMCALAPVRPVSGLQLLITGNLPRGSGLSSSASLCVGVGKALAEAADDEADSVALAQAAQRTEHEWVGVACGIMDQMAVAAGEPGKALMLDCRDLSRQQVALPHDWAVGIVDSGVTRGLVDGEYNARRAQCESAAAKLGVASLRDADLAMVESGDLDPLERKRALHVVEEIARVGSAARAIAAGDLPAMCTVLREGHASLRDLFEVSVPAVDELVERIDALLGDAGAARMTGAGFGGSIVVVGERDAIGGLPALLARPVRLAF
ncbi:galactokinase [Qipengyuania gaetbuli]|uniref:galactokinase n=1 Tax=Qipengyuania gaetbuli TaxID=266952 RepID=UPI001CD472B3|nr:galactokinase [Qipengyuania gaetbuli]MCA0909706.1 galactokinase [Qipengyuania gaetbuli]